MIHENISIGLAGQLEEKVKNIDYALMLIVGLSRDYLGIKKGFSRYYPRVSNLDCSVWSSRSDPREYIHWVGRTARGEGKDYFLMYSWIIMGLSKDYWRIMWITINGLLRTEQSNLDLIVQFDSPDNDRVLQECYSANDWGFLGILWFRSNFVDIGANQAYMNGICACSTL